MGLDLVTDEMLTKPAKELTPAEIKLLIQVFSGPDGDKLIERINQLRIRTA